MPKVLFTSNIQRHVACPEVDVTGRSVREVLENVFAANPQARGYVLDEQSALRKHMIIFGMGDRSAIWSLSRRPARSMSFRRCYKDVCHPHASTRLCCAIRLNEMRVPRFEAAR
jgi:hypothetical protein